MPKETIHSADPGSRIEVGWSRDRFVQVGTVPDESAGVDRGWWATLDRDGINRLVRALRRARDQAYGADA